MQVDLHGVLDKGSWDSFASHPHLRVKIGFCILRDEVLGDLRRGTLGTSRHAQKNVLLPLLQPVVTKLQASQKSVGRVNLRVIF